MKTTETITKADAISKLENAVKNSMIKKNTVAHRLVLDFINSGHFNPEYKYRPVYTLGRGRYISLHDHMGQFCSLLDACGFIYRTGNDAPRGGRTGAFVRIITKVIE